jgi:hypothetical protein
LSLVSHGRSIKKQKESETGSVGAISLHAP